MVTVCDAMTAFTTNTNRARKQAKSAATKPEPTAPTKMTNRCDNTNSCFDQENGGEIGVLEN